MHTCKKMMNQSDTERSLQDYYISCVSNGETTGVQYGIDMAWSKTNTCWKSWINYQNADTQRLQNMSALCALNKQIPTQYRKICQHVVIHDRIRTYGTHEYSLTANERHSFLTPTKY